MNQFDYQRFPRRDPHPEIPFHNENAAHGCHAIFWTVMAFITVLTVVVVAL